jgi:hypothetical protein
MQRAGAVVGGDEREGSPCQTPLFSNLAVPLADEKWAEIAAKTGMPSAARADIEGCIGWWRFAQERQLAASLAAKQLPKSTSGMLKQLETLEAHPHVYCLQLDLPTLKRLAEPQKRGRSPWSKTALEHQFVKLIAEVLAKHTGERITRSYKSRLPELVTEVCKLAANIGPGTVDAALKGYIGRRAEVKMTPKLGSKSPRKNPV